MDKKSSRDCFPTMSSLLLKTRVQGNLFLEKKDIRNAHIVIKLKRANFIVNVESLIVDGIVLKKIKIIIPNNAPILK